MVVNTGEKEIERDNSLKNKEKLALFRLNFINKIDSRPNDVRIIDACEKLGVSFPTYYKWKRRLSEAGKDSITALFDRRPSGKKHYKSLTPEQEDAIIEIIIKYPEYGSQRISAALIKNEYGMPVVSNGGVQKFLERRGLNLMRDRVKFAENYFRSINMPIKEDRNIFISSGNKEELAASGMVNI